MKLYNNEKLILNSIKFGPILLVLIISFLITQFFLHQRSKDFYKEIYITETAYLDKNKERVKEEVTRVYNYIKSVKEQSEQRLVSEIKERVYLAHNIATNIYNEELKNKDENFDKKQVFKTIKNALSAIRYNNGRGYIFMDDINGVKLLQPIMKEFEGKSFLDFKDAKGYKFVQKIVETIKNKSEGFDSYYWYKNGDLKNSYKKTSFYKYFAPFNLAIGTGEYVDDFNNELKTEVINEIQKIRYGENGYIFIFDSKGNTLSTFDKERIGTNRFNIKVTQDTIDFAKNHPKGDFFSYSSTVNPNNKLNSTDKISYLMYFKDWDWVIGSGFYLDALHKDIEERKAVLEKSTQNAIKEIIYLSILITIIFIIISSFLSKIISNKFVKYKNDIQKEIKNKIEKEKLLVQQSKMATMGEMIANIAHQWKQPLSIISASNGMLKFQKELKDEIDDSQIDEATEAIEVAVKNLSNTIDDFRNFFNPNKISEYFNIRAAFEKTFKLINTHLKAYDIHIVTDIENVEIKSLQNELLQILINVLKNAKDELVHKKDLKDKLILIKAFKENDTLIISIKDNAGGIPKEVINHIFNPYFTTKGDRDGTGIGLYMSKQIIQSLKGNIIAKNCEYTFEGQKYKGAEFKIELPIILQQ
jgi:signal transduction histidine kinase